MFVILPVTQRLSGKTWFWFVMKLAKLPSFDCIVLLPERFVATGVSSVIISYIFRSSTAHSSE